MRPKTGSAGSGTTGRRRIRRWSPAAVLGEDDSWRRCGAPAVAWLGVEERGGRGGASGPVREARGRRWLQLRRTVLVALCSVEERRGRGENSQGRRGGRHGLVHVSWRGVGEKEASTRRSRGWPRVAVHAARSCFSSWQRRKTIEGLRWWAGPDGWAASWAGQVGCTGEARY